MTLHVRLDGINNRQIVSKKKNPAEPSDYAHFLKMILLLLKKTVLGQKNMLHNKILIRKIEPCDWKVRIKDLSENFACTIPGFCPPAC